MIDGDASRDLHVRAAYLLYPSSATDRGAAAAEVASDLIRRKSAGPPRLMSSTFGADDQLLGGAASPAGNTRRPGRSGPAERAAWMAENRSPGGSGEESPGRSAVAAFKATEAEAQGGAPGHASSPRRGRSGAILRATSTRTCSPRAQLLLGADRGADRPGPPRRRLASRSSCPSYTPTRRSRSARPFEATATPRARAPLTAPWWPAGATSRAHFLVTAERARVRAAAIACPLLIIASDKSAATPTAPRRRTR